MSTDRESARALPDIETVRQLLQLLEAGDEAGAGALLDGMVALRESLLFQHIGKLTRDIHDSLISFQVDSRITQLADKEIPDAKERLRYVIEMTDQSAHRTLNAVEACLPIAESIEGQGNELLATWERFRNRELSIDEFKSLSQQISDFLSMVAQGSASMRSELSDVMMAQDFQDLTGQIIRRVINLVQEVEDKLVDLVRLAGDEVHRKPATKSESSSVRGEGPTPPSLAGDDRVASQDDVDDLLSSLGF
ncbi:MAG: protein phosphatase CheZ [Gammaproteobacteria bacterium]